MALVPLTFDVYDYIYIAGNVNGRIYMNFREAVDELCEPLNHKEVAAALGVSVQTIRQARVAEQSAGFRVPPRYWRDAIIRMAERRIMHYRQLIDRVRREEPEPK